MSQKNRIASAFGGAAGRYDKHAAQQQQVLARLWEMAKEPISHAPHLLDVGCGTGALARHTTQPVIGLDLALGMCEQARRKGMLACRADMQQMPFASGSQPALMSSLAMQWSDDLPGLLAEMLRICQPAALLAISTYLAPTLNSLHLAFKALGNRPPIRQFVSHAELITMINHAGLEVIKTQCDTFKVKHNSLIDLFNYMKRIGAHSRSSSGKGLSGAQQLRALEAAYLHAQGSLDSVWEVGCFLLRKAS